MCIVYNLRETSTAFSITWLKLLKMMCTQNSLLYINQHVHYILTSTIVAPAGLGVSIAVPASGLSD